MAALVATVVTAEKKDPEEDTLEVEDIPEAVVVVDHTVKDGEMTTVVVMAEEAMVEEEDTLEVEDIPEAVVVVDHTVKVGEMIMVVVMAAEAMVEDMIKVTVVKDMITRDPLVVAMVL